ncbi:MAG: anhydro-N-acetylmuramic acid kinase [Gammaproteobacteria bacterium]|jgi:anhydro-N-acetylmuramic acid kinase|nr:anhydro-N-acetylmuramic acid kinase [Gammaproteobacteria bacterium]MDH3904286.1 anhydro-N-acetylmuramic acid kinase [Gammaproteobacteria bacterium]MDH4004036.1 anhydro-N-acetylmuramic acid kinase [Gammaproteobacteria bacterium]NCF59052.1 anhydro-N-acetylmuramic acid kinase [Gammaproteobacteria bacterium]
MPDHYIGLISGTSMDGVDAALMQFGDHSVDIVSAGTSPYPEALREKLMGAARAPDTCTADVIGALDHWVGECFRDAALRLLQAAGVEPGEVRAIGSHGQTIRHRPDEDRPFTLQIGNADVIAKGTGIDCVANFRGADLALGGQGAPLVPPFHEWLFRSADVDRCALNIGGIANITVLPAAPGPIRGFDTGPGNTLMDAWIRRHRAIDFDDGGRWAASGTTIPALLETMLADPYFAKSPPKSTGFEYFNEVWLSRLIQEDADPADVQATLADLAATTIADAIGLHAPQTRELLICGGGVHNQDLIRRLEERLAQVNLASTAEFGLDPDHVEAAAFAWLAMRTMNGEPGNAPEVTGASRKTVLGALHRCG